MWSQAKFDAGHEFCAGPKMAYMKTRLTVEMLLKYQFLSVLVNKTCRYRGRIHLFWCHVTLSSKYGEVVVGCPVLGLSSAHLGVLRVRMGTDSHHFK